MSLTQTDSSSGHAVDRTKSSRFSMHVANLSRISLPILPPQRQSHSYAALTPPHRYYAQQEEDEPEPLCSDWIFTSASNAHIAIDKGSFKKYTPFESYVLTVADKRHLSVRGIGCVELKVKRSAKSSESHTVLLENVLHVPEWVCNIFSDTFFDGGEYAHLWTSEGAAFWEKKYVETQDEGAEEARLVEWGYTHDLFGLEKLRVVEPSGGRSIITEEYDANGKEIWCVNLAWPASQMMKWKMFGCKE
ncbi:MAG: hypothetical protein Q9160_002546 [Pyrenula sp. 1 TL-2023]